MTMLEVDREVIHGEVVGDRGPGKGGRCLLWRQALNISLLSRRPRRVCEASGLRLMRMDRQ